MNWCSFPTSGLIPPQTLCSRTHLSGGTFYNGAHADFEAQSTSEAVGVCHVVKETDNCSELTFLYDGDWVVSGRRHTKRTDTILANSNVRSEFASDGLPRGVKGLRWYVIQSSLDVCFNMVFSNSSAIPGRCNACRLRDIVHF